MSGSQTNGSGGASPDPSPSPSPSPEVPWPMRFGIFLAPFHRVGENPTLALTRDLELISWLDELGYDEAWVGEHHSGGWETIGAPEVFLAAAAERTRHIRLGTGVTSLPYHHPFMVAQRMVLLDHLTRGRVMLGVGPGALVTDAMMLGIEPATQRPRMAEALDVIVRLLTELTPVTYEGDWFTLRDAVLQIRPYTRPHFPIAVASTGSPAGMVLAGRHGFRVLQLGPAMGVRGAVDLRAQWRIGEEAAAAAGKTLRREEWSLVIPIHLAETRREAFDSAREGAAAELLDYFGTVLGRPCPVEGPRERVIEQMAASGTWIVGTPEDCVAGIRRYQEATGGFGAVLLWAHNWASREATRRSYELLARYVMPRFQGSLAGVEASSTWAAAHAGEFRRRALQAVERAHQEFEARPPGGAERD